MYCQTHSGPEAVCLVVFANGMPRSVYKQQCMQKSCTPDHAADIMQLPIFLVVYRLECVLSLACQTVSHCLSNSESSLSLFGAELARQADCMDSVLAPA